ncbi:MAG: nicotinate-nucleotide adenylyltransferase [Dehalococcoidia bacterium]|nr:MAG: nicotinate-nucleotide adenylyltransferase [Dehalococcoidia bacterium]
MAEYKVGVLGGTFDPVHLGHLIVAEDVRQKLGLQEVLLIPAGQPSLKESRSISEAEHRLEMVILATASNPYLNVSTIEIERPGPSYSVDTIIELKAGMGAGTKIYFIAGYDTLADLHHWKDPRRLVEMCQVVAVARPGHNKLDMRPLGTDVRSASDRIMKVQVPQIDISATGIRQRVARGLSIRYLVPEAVEDYIMANNLYVRGVRGS